MAEHISFPSIEQFSNVKRAVQRHAQFVGLDEQNTPIYDNTKTLPKVLFEGTVKLHGTNAGICFKNDGTFHVQSRENIITPEKDNAGFAKFTHSLSKEDLDVIRGNFPENWETITVYGEWAGQGIQSNVAVCQLPKTFYIFAARNSFGEESRWLDIRNWNLPESAKNIYSYKTFEIEIDFERPERAIDQINKWVLEVEAECPVGKAHGVSSIGEGICWKPINDPNYSSSRFWWKAKGSLHSKSKVRKLATVDVEKSENIHAFVEKVVEEGRLEQGYQWLASQGLPQDQKSTGDFLRWVIKDIIKENSLEMEASGIKEEELGKVVQVAARRWYFGRINK